MGDSAWPMIVTEATDPARTHGHDAPPIASKPQAIYEPGSFRRLWLWYIFFSTAVFLFWIVTLVTGSIAILLLAALAGAGATVLFMVSLYRSWKQLQAGETRATPREAVGLLFVPIYNFYWVFVAIGGLTRQINECLSSIGRQDHRAHEGIATAFSVCAALLFPPISTWVFWDNGNQAQAFAIDDLGFWLRSCYMLALWALSVVFLLHTSRASEIIARA